MKIFTPNIELVAATILFALSVILWPISMMTFAKEEPPVVLSLSWLALIICLLHRNNRGAGEKGQINGLEIS